MKPLATVPLTYLTTTLVGSIPFYVSRNLRIRIVVEISEKVQKSQREKSIFSELSCFLNPTYD